MPLSKDYIRDGNRKIIASVTSGFSAETKLVRDEGGEILGRTSERFHNSRDGDGKVVSVNTSDPGLLIKRKK